MAIFTFTNTAVVILALYLYATISNLQQVVDPLKVIPQEAATVNSPDYVHPLWPRGQRFSLALFLSSTKAFKSFKLSDLHKSKQLLLYRPNLIFNEGTIDSISLDIKVHESGYNKNFEKEKVDATTLPASATTADAEHIDIVAPQAIWSLLRSNKTNVFLHVALLQSLEEAGVTETAAAGGKGKGKGEEEGEGASSVPDCPLGSLHCSDQSSVPDCPLGSLHCSDQSSMHNDLAASSRFVDNVEITQEVVESGNVLHGTVQLVRRDMVPRAYQKRFLLQEAAAYWERGVCGNVLSSALGAPLSTLFQQMTADEQERAAYPPSTMMAFWKPQAKIKMVTDWSVWPMREMPNAVLQNVVEYRGGESSNKQDASNLGHAAPCAQNNLHRKYRYKPFISTNEIGLTSDKYIPLNSSLSGAILPLTISFSEQSLQQWLFLSTIQSGMEVNKAALGVSDQDLDEVRRMISETSLNMLLLTFIASALHMFFEVLAFHSDIEFWRSNQSLAGLSVRAVCTELVSQIIIFLYLLDSDTSMLVLVPAGVGIIIQLWKVWKTTGISLAIRNKMPQFMLSCLERDEAESNENIPPMLPKSEGELQAEKKAKKIMAVTAEADRVATTHLTLAFLPLLIGFGMRSLILDMHYSWASWCISTLTACVYTFGFILMCPQLYINHKLNSVSHLPWKFLACRFINTFIDDLFAFIIKMPTMHRLSVFRDDIVFIVYIWQRWKYKTDTDRPVDK